MTYSVEPHDKDDRYFVIRKPDGTLLGAIFGSGPHLFADEPTAVATAHWHAMRVRHERSTRPSITCPECGATSYHPDDIAEGYCARCNAWTGGGPVTPPGS